MNIFYIVKACSEVYATATVSFNDIRMQLGCGKWHCNTSFIRNIFLLENFLK